MITIVRKCPGEIVLFTSLFHFFSSALLCFVLLLPTPLWRYNQLKHQYELNFNADAVIAEVTCACRDREAPYSKA